MASADPVLSVDTNTLTYFEGKYAIVAPNARLTDDNLNFAGGTLTIKGVENASRWDYLGIRNQGSGPGQIGLANDSVTYGGVEIGKLYMKAPVAGRPVIYKHVDGEDLHAYIINPPETSPPKTYRPAIVLIHGGGWTSGGPGSLQEKAFYLASRGMVCVLIEYRLLDIAGNDPPIPCLQDVKSAVRWVRSHAVQLGVNPYRIATGGGSVGGQMAAGAAMIRGMEDPNDNLAISSKPNAVMMFYAEIDNGPGRWGYGRVGNLYPKLSPAYNVSPDDPPVVAFFAGLDPLIPQAVRDKFVADMRNAHVRLDLHLYPRQFHGFDAYVWNNPFFYDTLRIADEFFISLGWLTGVPTIRMPKSAPPDTWEAESIVSFNSRATPAAVTALMRNVRLLTTHDPGLAARTITWQLNDGAGGISNLAVSHTSITPVNDAPQVNLFGVARYVEGARPFLLVPTTVILDPDSPIMNGPTIRVSYANYCDWRDRLELQFNGNGPRQINSSGNVLLYEGLPVGTWRGGHGSTPLVVKFWDETPLLPVQEVIRRVSFRTLGTDPTTTTRMVRFVVDDGESVNSISRPAFKQVEVVRVAGTTALNDQPVVALGGTTIGYQHDAAAILLAAGATVIDVDSPDFNGGQLTVRLVAGMSSANRLGIAGGFAVDARNNVWYGGQIIGMRNARGGVGKTDLTITFKTAATKYIVETLLRAVNFKTVSGGAGTRTVLFSLTDGDGGSGAAAITMVNVS